MMFKDVVEAARPREAGKADFSPKPQRAGQEATGGHHQRERSNLELRRNLLTVKGS